MLTNPVVQLVLFSARKATAAFLSGFAAALGAAAVDGVLTGKETVAALGVGLAAAAVVYATPRNTPEI